MALLILAKEIWIKQIKKATSNNLRKLEDVEVIWGRNKGSKCKLRQQS